MIFFVFCFFCSILIEIKTNLPIVVGATEDDVDRVGADVVTPGGRES